MFVHRLVAQEFIPNPNNFPEINHKDENKTNNNIDNLEWCNRKYNSNYGTRKERTKKNNINYKGENTYWYGKHHSEETKKKMRENHVNYSGSNNPNSKKIYCIELNKTWDCIKDCAEELKLHHQSISKVCKGKLKTTGGYHFEYLKEKN